jgi:hypothetical protein
LSANTASKVRENARLAAAEITAPEGPIHNS